MAPSLPPAMSRRMPPASPMIGGEYVVWNGRPPVSARGAVQTYIGRLRGSLTPYGVRISTRGDGYLVEADGHRIDVDEFGWLVRQASGAADPAERVRLLDLGLALWRGPLLADAAGSLERDP